MEPIGRKPSEYGKELKELIVPLRWREDNPIPYAVIKDFKSRVNKGREKYGTPLTSKSCSDPVTDAYEEVMDALFYLSLAKHSSEEKLEDLKKSITDLEWSLKQARQKITEQNALLYEQERKFDALSEEYKKKLDNFLRD